PILYWSGWRWDLLPLLTLLVATAAFGFLLPCAWLVTGLFRGGGVDAEAFYKTPLAFVFYSMTFYLVILYPAALLTQHLLRRGMVGSHQGEPAASPNGGAATPVDRSRASEGPPSVS